MGNIRSSHPFQDYMPGSFERTQKSCPRWQRRLLINPGLFENIDRSWKSLQPKASSDLKLCISKNLGGKVFLLNYISLDPSKPNEYIINSKVSLNAKTLLGGEELDPGDFLSNVIDNSTIDADIRLFTKYFELPRCSINYRGDNYSSSLIGSLTKDLEGYNKSFALQYLQSVSRKAAVGFEYMYTLNRPNPVKVSLVGRYSKWNDLVCTGKLQSDSAVLHLCRKLAPTLRVGLEVKTEFLVKNITGALSYQFSLPEYDAFLQGTVDSRLNVLTMFTKTMKSFPLTCSIALDYDFARKDVKTRLSFMATV